MLTFEALLVKELQKQQSRAEFCDTVLQTQGVSVPVHSCVLSAFSPKLCGTLSAMPSPLNGQRRLIEVQAVEACTLLSLVSLLYSGQFKEDKEEVLLAACKLGINIPQREAKRLATEKNTQTEWMKEVAERECQTESVPTLPSEYRNHKETIATVIGPSSCISDQGLCTYTDGSDITLATLNNGQGNPENIPSFQVMDVVPETPMYPSDAAPPPRRRGRPRKRPLPQQNGSRNFSGTSAPEQKTVTPPAPFLMHTAPLPAVNHTGLTQPMDWLIDDVIAQLPFMPTNQHAITNPVNVDSNVDHPRSQSPVKLTDLGVVQPQSEGELTDILDSFLRTFEQHVGLSESDVQDDITDGSQTCEHTNTSNAHATSMNTTTQGENASLYTNRPQVSIVPKPQKPSGYWQVSDLTMEISPAQQGEEKPGNVRMTRSQSRKRKLEIIEELPRRNELPAKPKRERKKERLEKPMVEASLPREKKRRNREPHGEQKGTSSTVDSTCSVASALRRVINIASARNVKCSTKTTTLDGSESSELTSLVKRKQAGHAKRDSSKTLLEGRTLKVQSSTGTSQPKRQVLKNKTAGNKTRPALSAFELMKKILENQQNREEERKREYHRTVMKPKRNRRRKKNTQVHGAEVLMTNNTEMDDTIMVEEHNNSRIHQKHEETKGRMEEVGNQMTMCLQQTLPPAKDCRMSNAEKLMESYYNKARLETADSPNEAPFQRCSAEGVMFKNMSDMPFVSRALDPTVPLEKLLNTQGETDGLEEDEDVDVVEVSSSLSESFSVLPVTVDIVPSTEEEEDDDDEDLEIDVTSLGSN
ncbi:uncharacterized protein LOC120460801 isoform X2 [Pimephales promelas]|uniref:uncharacterized protein LOC120460801 isoform X2 n=1 Tax=Pimephales promelas TaxID=90988 RepID=UPI001955C963|nr:uncharacterized protein LOC120460801 isoform X2 [Pimephales promelas]KAG1962534.1 BTB/POZ domain-containing protein [Pimephales promelas]